MRDSSAIEVPVVGQPLPPSVRAEIHALIRAGLTFVAASEVDRLWYVDYRDGSTRKRRLVPIPPEVAAA